LDLLKELGIGRTFLTNNTSRNKAEYVYKLRSLGIQACEEDIYTPADSAIAYLHERLPLLTRLAVLGTPSLCLQCEQAGFSVGWHEPEAVIVGFDTTLTYDRLCLAAYWIQKGLPFIATHPDLVCPTDEDTVLVDCGAITACLTAATGRSAVVLGKPDPSILLDLCRSLALPPDRLAMAGDRIYTDMSMARRAGVLSVLVLTGEATAQEAAAMETPPDFVLPDLGDFGKLLVAERTKATR
jgi:NagD protein